LFSKVNVCAMLVFKVAEVRVVVVPTEGIGAGIEATVPPFPLQTAIHISQNLGVSPEVDAVFTAIALLAPLGFVRKTPGE
jgi:hypothetical protein